MANIDECTHIELYKVLFFHIELIDSKVLLCIYLNSIITNIVAKKIGLPISNIADFMKDTGIQNTGDLNGRCIKCLINEYNEVNYISFSDEWFVCEDLGINGGLL